MVIRAKVLRNPRRVVIIFRRGNILEESAAAAPQQVVPRSGPRRLREGGAPSVLTPAGEEN